MVADYRTVMLDLLVFPPAGEGSKRSVGDVGVGLVDQEDSYLYPACTARLAALILARNAHHGCWNSLN